MVCFELNTSYINIYDQIKLVMFNCSVFIYIVNLYIKTIIVYLK